MYALDRERCSTIVRRARQWLFTYCRRNGIHYLVVPSSGGRDSAVTLGLTKEACELAAKHGYQLTSIGVTLPCHTPKKVTKLGQLAIRTFGAEELGPVDLSVYFDLLTECFGDAWTSKDDSLEGGIKRILRVKGDQSGLANWRWNARVASGNIKARLRMITAYHIAKMFGSAVVMSTDNLSEFWMAFWTICGDVGDIGLIQNLLKGIEVEPLAVYLGVPKQILAQAPDDGNGVKGGGDAAQLGAVYPELDRIMVGLIQQGFNMDGSMRQLAKLPIVMNSDVQVVRLLATRAIKGAYKRRGPVSPTRVQLGLPSIKGLDLD
ncbi:MAG: NAD(+) synthase [Patescibacteria group bacterium]